MRVNLDKVLNEKGKSIYWLAEKAKVSYPNLYNLTKNKTALIKFDTLERICIALDCTPNDILEIEKIHTQ